MRAVKGMEARKEDEVGAGVTVRSKCGASLGVQCPDQQCQLWPWELNGAGNKIFALFWFFAELVLWHAFRCSPTAKPHFVPAYLLRLVI